MRIIGITGTLGAGKGTAVEHLLKSGFKHYSVRDYLTRELIKRGEEVNRDTMVGLANSLRAEHGPSFIIEELYQEALASGGDCIIESIRATGEIEALRAKGDFILLAIVADQHQRYERIRERQSETDQISFERFQADEAREMTNSDPAKQNLAACIAAADLKLENNGSKEEFFVALDAALKEE